MELWSAPSRTAAPSGPAVVRGPGPAAGAGRFGAPRGGPAALVGAVAILGLFGGAFALGGAWALWAAWARRHGPEPNAWILWPLGLAFSLVGWGLLAALARGPAAIRRSDALAGRFPDEPWKWRDDWARGFARDDTRHLFGGALVFAVLWNLVSLPAAVVGWQRGVVGGQAPALVAFLFPLIGLGLLASAVREGLRWARYRVSRLEFDAVPVPVGRSLTGTVRTHLSEPPPGGFQLTLSCLRSERTGAGSSASTWVRVLWQDEATLPGRLAAPAPVDGAGAAGEGGPVVVVPVAFRVPAEALGTDHHDSANAVTWRLEVEAREPGVDYHATFELPVYRTALSERPETAADAVHLRTLAGPSYAVEGAAALADAPRPEPASPIRVAEEGGALAVDFPPGRNPAAALGVSACTVLWIGVTALLWRLHAPALFRFDWLVFDAILVAGAAWLWLWRTDVRVDAAGVTVAAGWGAPGRPRTVPRAEVADVRLAVGMTVGTTAYYDLKVVKRDGSTVAAGGSIRHKAEAEWIAARMLRTLGPPPAA